VKGAGIKVRAGEAPPYPEVSGYFIPTLLDWGERDRALAYARWLASIQNEDGSWSDAEGKAAYTFDTGQILKGLAAALPFLPEVESAFRRGSDWMLTRIEENGRITTPDKTAWRLPGGRMIPEKIHLYALEPLRAAARRFGEPRYSAAVDRALAYYLAQSDLISFDCLSHFHAYVMEALVDLGRADAAIRGMAEVEAEQRDDGSVPAEPGLSWTCFPGLAQYAVVWAKLGRPVPGAKALEYLGRRQNRSGGFFGSYGPGAEYFPENEISWAAKYFLDAAYWHVRTAFDEYAASFPDTIADNDGRLQAVRAGLGDLAKLRVLDAGCGRGRFIHALSAQFPTADIWGVDLSDGMLQFLPPKIQSRQGSLLNLPFHDASFDRVFSVEALEHSVNPKAAVREMARVLAPGGRLVIVDKNRRRRGSLPIEAWERWFGLAEVESWMKRYCRDVQSELIGYDGPPPLEGLFVCWQGTRQ
jgi:malonyl-CoA O-methyltransferase